MWNWKAVGETPAGKDKLPPEQPEQVSEKQYGFRRGKSTLDAIRDVINKAEAAALGPTQYRDLCAVIAVDVRNAFNSAPLVYIDAAL